MPIIKVEQLKKYYGDVKAVEGLSFAVNQGELFGFLGVNGAGKSTTINMLSTLIAPTEGNAQICGLQLGKENEQIRRKIGIVYQQNCLDNMLSVEENLMCRAYLYEKSTSKNKNKLIEVCKTLSLDDVRKRRYGKLSGGQKRRCEIAAALMHTPEILFLDEPTTGLDPSTRKNVWETVETLRQQQGMTVFLTTHYMEEAAHSNHIVIIDSGKMIAQGTPFELKEQYATDTLKLYADDFSALIQTLEQHSVPFAQSGKSLSVGLKNTMASLMILDMVKDGINGFEVIQGTMDDVFLNASGGKILCEKI